MSPSISLKVRRNSSARPTKAAEESKKGQRLIEKETMETGKVCKNLNVPKINLNFVSKKTRKALDLSCFNQERLVHEVKAQV